MKHWIKAFRLRTLPLSFSNILLGSALAYYLQKNTPENFLNNVLFGDFNITILVLTLLTTLLLQILSNLANDYGDAVKGADNEGRIGPERAIQSGAITPKAMLTGIIITALLALIAGISLLFVAFENELDGTFIVFLLLGLGAIGAAIKYTVGKRAYGYIGLGDLFVFIFFGLVGVIGTFYLYTHFFDWLLVFPAVTMGCFCVAVLNLNNMRDQENDKAVGKNTLVVKLGFKRAKIYHYLIFIVAYISFPIPFLIYYLNEGQFIAIIPVLSVAIIHFIHLVKVAKIENPKHFDPELKKIALSAFLFSLLFFGTIYFIH